MILIKGLTTEILDTLFHIVTYCESVRVMNIPLQKMVAISARHCGPKLRQICD